MFDPSQTSYKSILQSCLSRVDDRFDKREGSIIYDALAPACAQLAVFYSVLSGEMDRAFPDTATDVDLTNKAKERGIFRLPATYAVRKGIFAAGEKPAQVPLGSRFSGGDCNYVVTEKLTDGQYTLQCEEAGEQGNRYFGVLFPIDYIEGLSSAQIGDVLIPGEDEEVDETLRERYMQSLKSEAFGGNIADYREKVEKIPGVGNVKVFPVWNGGGTVKLVILSSEQTAPSAELIEQVQTEVDPEQNRGEGFGIAPIGHKVTVTGVEEKKIDVSMQLVLEEGKQFETVQESIEEAVEEYFAGLTAGWADTNGLVVRISQIESRILEVAGVLDIMNTRINSSTENLTLTPVQIPVVGEVTEYAG